MDNSWSYEVPDMTVPGVANSSEGNYVIFYTCKVCDNKQTRSFSKHSYH